MNKKDKIKIQKRCKDMATNFECKRIENKDLFEFGRALKNARNELTTAQCLAHKMFYKRKDEYKIIEELRVLIEEYRNHMDNKPVEIMLPEADSRILNRVFYGPDYIEDDYIVDFLENK